MVVVFNRCGTYSRYYSDHRLHRARHTDNAYFISSAIGMTISTFLVFKAFQITSVVYTERIIKDAEDVLDKVDDVELREYLDDIQFELRKIRKDD